MRPLQVAIAACFLSCASPNSGITPLTDYIDKKISFRADQFHASRMEGGNDQLYFRLWNTEEMPSGSHILVLPNDWTTLPRVQAEDGVWDLESPMPVEWLSENQDPHSKLSPSIPRPGCTVFSAPKSVGEALNREHLTDMELARTILSLHESRWPIYLLARTEKDSQVRYELFGGIHPKHNWIKLLDMDFHDDRSPSHRTTANVARMPLELLRVIEYPAIFTLFTLPVWIWFV